MVVFPVSSHPSAMVPYHRSLSMEFFWSLTGRRGVALRGIAWHRVASGDATRGIAWHRVASPVSRGIADIMTLVLSSQTCVWLPYPTLVPYCMYLHNVYQWSCNNLGLLTAPMAMVSHHCNGITLPIINVVARPAWPRPRGAVVAYRTRHHPTAVAEPRWIRSVPS